MLLCLVESNGVSFVEYDNNNNDHPIFSDVDMRKYLLLSSINIPPRF